jgi:hypothetical protein
MLLLLPIPIDFVEQNPAAVTTNPVASGLVQLTPIFEHFLKQILALFAAATVSARRFSFAFTTSAHSLSFWLLF